MVTFYELENEIINLDKMESICCKDFLTRYKESKPYCMILESEQIECYRIIFTESENLSHCKVFNTKEERDTEYNRIKSILLK